MRDLEAAKLVVRTVRQSPSLRVSYHLSGKGESLAAIIQEIAAWAKAH
jgi:DNA-binding HxlR family transcriptional regulator